MTDEFLDAVVLRIGHVEIAGGIEGDAPRVAEAARFGAGAADDLDRFVIGIENLDATVAEFANILATGLIHANIIWITQFTDPLAGFSVGAEEGPIG